MREVLGSGFVVLGWEPLDAMAFRKKPAVSMKHALPAFRPPHNQSPHDCDYDDATTPALRLPLLLHDLHGLHGELPLLWPKNLPAAGLEPAHSFRNNGF